MKRQSILTFFLSTLLFLAVHFTSVGQTVYVTEGGKKYHMKNCTSVTTGKTGIEVSEAKKKGYTSCAVCKPDEKKGIAGEDPKKKK